MLQSGNDRVPPAHSMWPLFCNEVGLSYDQEERVRNYQRTLLQNPDSWLERHTAKASSLVMQSFHDCVISIGTRIRQRERGMMNGMSTAQKLQFYAWASKNAGRIKERIDKKKKEFPKEARSEKYQLSKDYHVAANLYILNHRLLPC